MILYCIRFFGATSGKFNFSNLQQPKEEKVKRPTSTFSALTSLIHVQGLHSHYQHTQTHTPCLSPALGPHTALSRSCPFHQPGSSLGTMNASLKGVFPPCSTRLGLGFSQVFLGVLSGELQTKPSFLQGNSRTRNVVCTFMDKGTFNVSAPFAS